MEFAALQLVFRTLNDIVVPKLIVFRIAAPGRPCPCIRVQSVLSQWHLQGESARSEKGRISFQQFGDADVNR